MDPSEKRKLARKAIRKNPDAYGALITEYKEYLYKMAYLYMKNEQDALDIVGTTILIRQHRLRKSRRDQKTVPQKETTPDFCKRRCGGCTDHRIFRILHFQSRACFQNPADRKYF